MMRLILLTACIAVSTAVPAFACMQPPGVTHEQETALLDKGLKTFKREPAVLAKAKKLRDQADAAFKAGKIGDAAQARHAGLIAIGYKVEEASSGPRDGPVPIGAIPAPAKSPRGMEALPAAGCTAGATSWVAPAE